METIYMIFCVLFIIRYTVNAVCPHNCNTCESYDKCTSCKSDKWNLNVSCVSTCSSNCLNQECQDDNGYCHQCKTGKYGIQCQRDCSFCEQELCDLRACMLGCKLGYFSFSDGSETFCQTCQTDCRTCRNSFVCDVCNDGFYLYKNMFNSIIYGRCSPCPDSSQSCKDLCAIQDCNKCQVLTDKIVCTECREGFEFNGDICVMKITECSKGCSTNCDDTGICLGSCNTGWSNERCSESCANQCLTCSRNNTNVCEQCKGDFYTTSCNIECPVHCNRMLSKQTCKIDVGYCLNDCERSFWGPFCNMTCPDGCSDDGISKLCEQSSGSCILECKDGFAGPACDISVSKTPTVESKDTTRLRITVTQSDVHDVSTVPKSTQFGPEVKDNNNGLITGYFSGIGSAALVASLIVAIFCIKRRYIKNTSNALKGLSHSNETHTYYNERIEQTAVIDRRTNGTNNYETLKANRQSEMVYSDLQRQI